jgi:protein-tyrosine phosphatase
VTDGFQILVVCIGNVCRSPLAAHLLAARLSGSDRRYVVSSAGTHGLVGEPMDPSAAAELRRLGGDPRDFVASRLEPRGVRDADLVLTATQRLRGEVLQLAPAALRRTFTLRELARLVAAAEVSQDDPAGLVAAAAGWRGLAAGVDPGELDLPDPIGRPDAVHREVADLIDDSCRLIAAALSRPASPAPPAS